MRKRIALAIVAVCLLLAAVLLTDNTYQPFAKLTVEDVSSVSVKLKDGGEKEFSDEESLLSLIEVLKEIKILFTGAESADPSAELSVHFADGADADVVIYKDSLSIDNKIYLISEEDSQALTARIEKICEG